MFYEIVTRPDENSKILGKIIEEKIRGKLLATKDKLVIVLGGDGTMLKAIHDHMGDLECTNFVGLHTGSLGFYADWRPEEVDELIEHIIRGEFNIQSYRLLRFDLCVSNQCTIGYALNEVTLINPKHTQVTEIFVDDKLLSVFRGTGLCISTQAGSTAYNKSLGGALIDPSVQAMQLVEIAPISNNVYRAIGSPMVFGENQTITLKANQKRHVTMTIDHKQIDLGDSEYEYIKFTLSNKTVKMAMYKPQSFWERVKRAFL